MSRVEEDSLLERIIANGNRGHNHSDRENRRGNTITCNDGFEVSVIAGGGVYCTPRPALCIYPYDDSMCREAVLDYMYEAPCTYNGPYTHVEVGFPSEVPEPWEIWSEFCEDPETPTSTVYGYVPVEDVRALIALHGGEKLVGEE